MSESQSGDFRISALGVEFTAEDVSFRIEFTLSAAQAYYAQEKIVQWSILDTLSDHLIRLAKRSNFKPGEVVDHPCKKFTVRGPLADIKIKTYVYPSSSFVEIWIEEIRT